MVARYLRYVPAAEQYLQLDFMFVRIQLKRLRYIAGLGRMGWVEAEEFESSNRLTLVDEATLLNEVQAQAPGNITVLGIDAYGIDYVADGFRDRQTLRTSNLRDAALLAAPKLR